MGLSMGPAGQGTRPQTGAESALDQAVQWAVRLQSGMAGEAEHHACAAWRSANPTHEEAWAQVQAVEQVFGAIPAENAHAARQALEAAAQPGAKPASRRRALSLLGVGTLAVISAGLTARLAPWSEKSTYVSRAGERRQVVLADGTRLQLNARTVVDVSFTPLQRLLVLREGEIFIDTGADARVIAGKRPFWVQAGQVRFQALGTAFAVEQAPPPQLHVRQGVVAIHLEGKAPLLAQAGETFRILGGDRAGSVERVLQPESDPTAWLDGALVAKRMRLDAFAAALSRYHQEPVFCDAEAAALRVSGVFQLDGPQAVDRALGVLAATLPVRIERTGKGEPIIALR